jgi:integrase
MQRTRGFHLVARPPGITTPFTHVVVDTQGMPHLPLTEFFHDLQKGHGDTTARTYLNILLPYFTYLQMDAWCQERDTAWEQPPEEVQVVVEEYLRERLGCKIQPHDTYATVQLTAQSPSTVKLFLAALKQFYTYARRVHAYLYEHPLIDHAARLFAEAQREREQILQGHPIRPSVSGVEPPRRFPPENYFRLKREDWVPQTIDDPKLPKHLLKAARKSRLRLVDQLVIRLAIETGARISEILGLTMGDWRAYGGRTKAKAFNKGSHGQRTKYVAFSKETARLLQKYLNGDRVRLDPQQRRMNQLEDSDPLFLSERRHPYSYAAFYPHWRKVCQAAKIKLTIHGVRHWHVTTSVRHLYAQKGQTATELDLARERLIRYIRWRSAETIKAYEHFTNAADHAPVLAQIQQEMYTNDARYVRDQERKPAARSISHRPKKGSTSTPIHPRPKATGSGWDEFLALGRKPDG